MAGVRSLLAFWVGGAEAPNRAQFLNHATDVRLVYQNTRGHATSTLRRAAAARTQAADTLVLLVSAHSHSVDTLRRAAATRAHATDTRRRATATRSHGVDALMRGGTTLVQTIDVYARGLSSASHGTSVLRQGVATRTQSTNALARAARTRTHASDAYGLRVVAVAHATDAVRLLVAARSHTTGSLARATRTRTHAADSQSWAPATYAHATSSFLRLAAARSFTVDALLRATRTPAHATDVRRRATAVRAHATGALSRLTPTLPSFTDVLSRRRPPGSRGYTQRVGARAAWSDGLRARQQAGTQHPIAFVVYDLAGMPAPGRALTVSLSKDGGGTWAPAQGAVRDAGWGWYSLDGHPADRDTLGELLLHVAAADPFVPPLDLIYDVVADDPHALPSLSGQERTTLADAVLARTWVGLAAVARTALNALRYARNRRTLDVNGILRVHAEDDATVAWSGRCRAGAGAAPVRGVDPDG